MIGTLVAMALPLQQNFIAIAIPAVIAAFAVAMIKHGRSASARARGAGAPVGRAVGTSPAVAATASK